jgi:signal transduction histidine kinase
VAVRIANVDLVELAQEVVDQLAPRAPRHSLRTSFPPNFPVIQGDADKLRRALFNLVENAVKYSPNGGEILVVGEAPSTGPFSESGWVVVRVIDHGIGIPPGEEEHIFERFHRADTRLSRSTTGFGLGLYITRSIIEAHGGRIWAESPGQGRGSVFSLTLPVQAHTSPPSWEAA